MINWAGTSCWSTLRRRGGTHKIGGISQQEPTLAAAMPLPSRRRGRWPGIDTV